MRNMINGIIKATSVSTFRSNLKDNLDAVYFENQVLIVTRPEDENVVVISEFQFNEILRKFNNIEYLLKLEKADKEIENGDIFSFDLEII